VTDSSNIVPAPPSNNNRAYIVGWSVVITAFCAGFLWHVVGR